MVRNVRRLCCGLAGMTLAAVVGLGSAAAGPYPNPPGPPVTPSGGPTAAHAAVRAAPVSEVEQSNQSLPFTGGDVIEILALGSAAAAAGAGAVVLARSRRRDQAREGTA